MLEAAPKTQMSSRRSCEHGSRCCAWHSKWMANKLCWKKESRVRVCCLPPQKSQEAINHIIAPMTTHVRTFVFFFFVGVYLSLSHGHVHGRAWDGGAGTGTRGGTVGYERRCSDMLFSTSVSGRKRSTRTGTTPPMPAHVGRARDHGPEKGELRAFIRAGRCSQARRTGHLGVVNIPETPDRHQGDQQQQQRQHNDRSRY